MELPEELLTSNERVSYALRSLYFKAGFERFRMAKFEEYDLYARNKHFLIDDNIITFTDRDGKLMALKPDVTLSIVKNTRDGDAGLRKVYYNENVYRVPKGADSFKEIMQAGIECIGALDEDALFEVFSLAAESLHTISDEYVLEISHMGVIASLLEFSGLAFPRAKRILSALEARSAHGLREALRDAAVAECDWPVYLSLLDAYGGPAAALPLLEDTVSSRVSPDVWREFSCLLTRIAQAPFAPYVRINFSLMNHADYYDGFIFAGYVPGCPQRVLAGGRYDGLMRNMGRTDGGIGFAVYLDGVDAAASDSSHFVPCSADSLSGLMSKGGLS